MRSIGFRAEKSELRYVVLDGDKNAPTVFEDETIKIREKGSLCDELVLFRTELANLLSRLKPDRGGLKVLDNPRFLSGIQSQFSRARVEGIVLLVAGEAKLPLTTGMTVTMKSKIGTKKNLKEYAAQGEVRGVDLTVKGRKNDSFQEAFFAALAALGEE